MEAWRNHPERDRTGRVLKGEPGHGPARPSTNSLPTIFLSAVKARARFVATHNEDRVQFRFLRLLPDDGDDHPHVSRLLECKRLCAPAEIARQLDLKPADPVVLIKRLLQFDGVTTVFDKIWLPGAVFRGLTAERLGEYKEGPLYATCSRPSSARA